MLLKSRRLWYEHGEKASKLLAHQLRKSESTHIIPEIKTQFGHITKEPDKINESFQYFHSNLYKSDSLNKPEPLDTFFDKLPVPTIVKVN